MSKDFESTVKKFFSSFICLYFRVFETHLKTEVHWYCYHPRYIDKNSNLIQKDLSVYSRLHRLVVV